MSVAALLVFITFVSEVVALSEIFLPVPITNTSAVLDVETVSVRFLPTARTRLSATLLVDVASTLGKSNNMEESLVVAVSLYAPVSYTHLTLPTKRIV